jgi:hypothetical protein
VRFIIGVFGPKKLGDLNQLCHVRERFKTIIRNRAFIYIAYPVHIINSAKDRNWPESEINIEDACADQHRRVQD